MVIQRDIRDIRSYMQIAAVLLLGSLIGVVSVALAGKGTLSPLVAIAVPVALGALFLLIIRCDWLLISLLVSRAAIESVFSLVKGASEGPGPGAAVNVAVLVLGALYLLRKPRAFARGHVVIWLVFLTLAALGTRYAPDVSKATRMWLLYLTYFFIFAIPVALISDRRDTRTWVLVLLLASVAPTIMGLIDMATGGVQPAEPDPSDLDEVMRPPEYAGFRIQGAFGHPNIYAFFLVTIISVMVYAIRLGLFERNRRHQWLAYGYLGLQLVMLLATQTRSAWAAVGMMLVAIGVFIDRRWLLIMVLGAIPLMFVPVVQDRIVEVLGGASLNADDAMNSYQWRKVMWSSAIPWIQDRMLLGWGLDSYTEYSTIFFPLEFIEPYDAHSVYIQLAFELGLPGVIAFVVIFIGMLITAARAFRRMRLESLLLGTQALAYLMACYSDNMHRYLVSNLYAFFFMGLLCAIVTLPANDERA